MWDFGGLDRSRTSTGVSVWYLYLALPEMSSERHNRGLDGLMPLNGVVKKIMEDSHDDEPSEFNVYHRLFKKKDDSWITSSSTDAKKYITDRDPAQPG